MGEVSPYILLADDDQELRTTLEKYSTKAGWQYDSVRDAGSLLDAATLRPYDAIVTDYVMPGMGGVELVRTLRERRPHQAVIVVAGSNSLDEVVSALREGADDYLMRPLDFDAFCKAVQRAISGSREREAHNLVFAFVEGQTTSYRFTAREVAEGRAALPIALKLFSSGQISLEQRLKLELAYQEAIANSLEHGDLELASMWKEEYDESGIDRFSREKLERLADPRYGERMIFVHTKYRKGKLVIVIQDEGKGFLPEECKRAALPSEILCHGRGVAIITAVMDEVIYSHRGTRLRMVKYL